MTLEGLDEAAYFFGRLIRPAGAASTLVYGFVSIVWRSHCSKFVAVRLVTSTVCPMAALSISSMPPAILAASSKRFSSMMECSHFQREVRCASEVSHVYKPSKAGLSYQMAAAPP